MTEWITPWLTPTGFALCGLICYLLGFLSFFGVLWFCQTADDRAKASTLRHLHEVKRK